MLTLEGGKKNLSVTLDKLHNLSETPFPLLKNEGKK